MKRVLVVASLTLLGVDAHALLSYTFDSNNVGWRRADFNSTTFQLTDVGPATWVAGGYLEEGDFAAWARYASPVLSGSQLDATEFSFDYAADATDNVAYPLAVIAGTSSAIFQAQIPISGGQFHHYAYDLTTAGTWMYADILGTRAATVADIQAVLANVTRIGVDADTLSGSDHTKLDNVRLSAVPEPASILALSGGLALLLRRRRR